MNIIQPLVFEDIRIEVPWGYIAGRWYGNRKVRPILAIHGWLDNLGTWDRLIPLMPRHIGILAIDLPGHGRSSKYPLGIAYHVFDYVEIIVRIIKAYKWNKVSLMGHSMGGVICFQYMVLYPHMVDMIIQIDVLRTTYYSVKGQINYLKKVGEKFSTENERLEEMQLHEPPSYTYSELENKLYNGAINNSVNKENCKYLLNRSIENSEQYPEKYYFSRDGRVKIIIEMPSEQGLYLEYAKRIHNKAHLIIRSEKYSLMTSRDEEIIDVLRSNNPHFEYYRHHGTHHLHLNNAEDVAKWINPFVLRHRPVLLDSWTLDDNVKSVNEAENKSKL